MNVVVCVKQIPDPAAPQSFDASHNLDRSGKLILDEADTYGVEMALQLVDKAGGGEVTVVSMGSAADVAGLRNALAMGAAKAVIVSDDSIRGTDSLGTAKVLAAVIRRAMPDLILCATESSDGYTGTTPVQLAELLGLPSITFAKSVTVEGSTVKVARQTESGYDEVTAPIPAVVADLGLASDVGPSGARQQITEVVASESRAAGEKYVDEGDGAEKIVAFLESIKVL